MQIPYTRLAQGQELVFKGSGGYFLRIHQQLSNVAMSLYEKNPREPGFKDYVDFFWKVVKKLFSAIIWTVGSLVICAFIYSYFRAERTESNSLKNEVYVANDQSDAHFIDWPVEVSSWNWYKDPNYGTKGSVRWTVEVKNLSNKYIDRVKVKFATYDANEKIITSSFAYVKGLAPYGTSTTSSFMTYFGKEETASIRIEPYSWK